MSKIKFINSLAALLFVLAFVGCEKNNTTDQAVTKTAIDHLTEKPWKISKVLIDGTDFTDLFSDQCNKSVSYSFRKESRDLLISRDLFHYKFIRNDTTVKIVDGVKEVKVRVVNDTTYCWTDEQFGKYPLIIEHDWVLSSDNKNLILKKLYPKQAKDSVLTVKELSENNLILTFKRKSGGEEFAEEISFKNN